MTPTLGERVNTRLFKVLQRLVGGRGYEIVSNSRMPPDYDQADIDLFAKVKPYTLTSHERVFALREAVSYVVRADIPGAIVECGVWLGSSMLIVANTLVELGRTDRDLYPSTPSRRRLLRANMTVTCGGPRPPIFTKQHWPPRVTPTFHRRRFNQ